MRKLITLTAGLFLLCTFSYAQTDTLENYRHTLKTYKSGDGNCKFSTNIKAIETFFVTSSRSLKQLESTFCSWWQGGDVKIAYNYNEKTKKHDIPEFTVQYTNTSKAYVPQLLKVTFGLDQKVSTISFVITEDKLEVDQIGNYIKQLIRAGYVFDIGNTRIFQALGGFNRVYAKNPKNKMGVMIACGVNKNTITVFRNSM